MPTTNMETEINVKLRYNISLSTSRNRGQIETREHAPVQQSTVRGARAALSEVQGHGIAHARDTTEESSTKTMARHGSGICKILV